MTHQTFTPEQVAELHTREHFEAMTTDEQQALLKASKGSEWYDNWKPYCLTCDTFNRMESQPYGFKCSCCKNEIGFDLRRLQTSPLNSPTYVVPKADKMLELGRLLAGIEN